jgi:ribonuclease HI
MESIITYVAGRSEGNPGPAGVGIYITEVDGKLVHEAKQAIGNANEDFAAYYAVIGALDTLKEIFGDATPKMHFELRLDNELTKKQLNSEVEITNPGSVPMFIDIHNRRVVSFPNITLTLIQKEQNKEADKLATEAASGK